MNHSNSNATPSLARMTAADYLSRSNFLRLELDRVRGVLTNYALLPIDNFTEEPELLSKARQEWDSVLRRFAALDAAFFDEDDCQPSIC